MWIGSIQKKTSPRKVLFFNRLAGSFSWLKPVKRSIVKPRKNIEKYLEKENSLKILEVRSRMKLSFVEKVFEFIKRPGTGQINWPIHGPTRWLTTIINS